MLFVAYNCNITNWQYTFYNRMCGVSISLYARSNLQSYIHIIYHRLWGLPCLLKTALSFIHISRGDFLFPIYIYTRLLLKISSVESHEGIFLFSQLKENTLRLTDDDCHIFFTSSSDLFDIHILRGNL